MVLLPELQTKTSEIRADNRSLLRCFHKVQKMQKCC